jgi:HAD superfamily hydrolase (TIGR01549 family)
MEPHGSAFCIRSPLLCGQEGGIVYRKTFGRRTTTYRYMIRAIIFDLDDTLVDHSHSRRMALKRLAKDIPAIAKYPVNALESCHDRQLSIVQSLLQKRKLAPSQSRTRELSLFFAHYNVTFTEAELTKQCRVFAEAYDSNRRAVPGAKAFVAAVSRKVSVAVVTNGLMSEQKTKLRRCGLDGYIEIVVNAEAAGSSKPNRKIFHLALQRLGVEADSAVMLGDSWHHDVMGAIASGISAVWFNRTGEKTPRPGIARELQSFLPIQRALAVVGLSTSSLPK